MVMLFHLRPRIKLPDWVKDQNLDPTIYPLLPSIPKSRRSVSNLEKFIAFGIAEQRPGTVLRGLGVAEPNTHRRLVV